MASPITPYIDWERGPERKKLLELMRFGTREQDIAKYFGKNVYTILAAIRKHTPQSSQNNWSEIKADRAWRFKEDPAHLKALGKYEYMEKVCQGHPYSYYRKHRYPRRVNEPVPFRTDDKPMFEKMLSD